MRTLILLFAVLLGMAGVAQAAPPVLSEVPDAPLRDTYRADQPYTIRMRYRDKEGDAPRLAEFVDEAPDGNKTYKLSKTVGGDYETGVILEWNTTGFSVGEHKAYFLIADTETLKKPTRWTKEGPGESNFYTFVVESLWLKIGIMAVGVLVGLLFVPFLVYLLARSLNRQGDPSTAARVGLLLGVVACIGLAVQQFAGYFPPLFVWGFSILIGLAIIIVIFTRR